MMSARSKADDMSDTSSPTPSDERDEDGWEDAEPDEELVPFVSFFDNTIFTSAKSMLDYCKERYSFDFVAIQKKHNLDFYQSIKFVNYIRTCAKQGQTEIDDDPAKFADDRYLQPVLEDDALLFSLDDIGGEEVDVADARSNDKDPAARVVELEEQLKALQSQFAEFRLQVDSTLERRWNETSEVPVPESTLKQEQDGDYFQSYSYNAIHEEMLKDSVRTDAYRDFIYDNKHLFEGKTVLDVGCGTGILSMFCAKAGAARVIAVDNSDIIYKAMANVQANKLDDKITCLRGKIEEIKLPVKEVDIIVSEWMGYCLLFEAMLDSVLWARDRYLKPDGLMVPSHCTLHVAPLSDEDFVTENIEFWRDVYGFDMTAMQEKICEDILVRHMPEKSLAGVSTRFAVLPLHTITVNELDFVKNFQVTLDRDVDSLDGWLVYFDTFFLTSRKNELPRDARAETWSREGVAFTTGPQGKETHWKSGIMLVDRSKKSPEASKSGSVVKGTIEYRKGKVNSRGIEVEVKWQEGDAGSQREQLWYMK